ncbi:SMI1/KNR4 family protein [Streptomyces sp. NBC_00249]|uniref:SMI1/KNR4 family protein n=1 Tax=Streptomyces sp. NBC_00249 TaxID=2975690 RepID=UPI002255FA89|nr:SMI1/KNR4 family protein [Streptomyces sp. NBC_00249]MCX5192755.1 SMI1/KNR4 family protein [Streptomyces sp. NBC_00249]
MMIDDWEPFLRTWSTERDAAVRAEDPSVEPLGWLGFEPAPAERIEALEARLGARLPPSYRSFLAVTDGWRWAGESVYLLAGTERVGLMRDLTPSLRDSLQIWDQEDVEEMDEEEIEAWTEEDEENWTSEQWQRAVQISLEGDQTWLFLDPGDVDDRGEWAAYRYSSWRGEGPDRHASFGELMHEEFRSFHRLRKPPGETRRRLAAQVERARTDLLAGRLDEAESQLADAHEFRLPAAAVYLSQIRGLRGDHSTLSEARASLTKGDPLLARAVLPVLAAVTEQRSTSHQVPDNALGGHRLRFREGPWQPWADEALDRARELAKWGDPEAAWQVLATEALPGWTPVGDHHVAPVELMADPFLAPLITPERARRILTTPRPGTAVAAGPAEAASEDPSGLLEGGWHTSAVCLTFARATEPRKLAIRLGAGPEPVRPSPDSLGAALFFRPEGTDRPDRSMLHLGVAAGGWSFVAEASARPVAPSEPPVPGISLWRTYPDEPVQVRYADQDGRVVWSLTAPPEGPYDADGPVVRGGADPGLLDAELAGAGLLRADGLVVGRDPGLVAVVARRFGLYLTPCTARRERLPFLSVARPEVRPTDGTHTFWERG